MIETRNLTKHYGSLTAVEDLSFQVESGEVLGFLGPNGAGKSTTMKMITGFVPPTAGTAVVDGFDILEQPLEAKRRMGYLPEGAPSYPEMTPLSFLEFIASVREIGADQRRRRLDEVISLLHLEPVLAQSIETLSKGFKRRVGLAQAIIHDPAVLIMDEPTDGLDPNQKHEVRELISSMASEKLIIISTHILEEVEALCSRAIIIADGTVRADATPGELAARSRYHNAVQLSFVEGTDLNAARAAIDALDPVATTEIHDEERRLTVFGRNSDSPLKALTALLHGSAWEVASLSQERGRLDEVFREITAGAKL